MQPDQFNHLKVQAATVSAAQVLELEAVLDTVVAQQFVEMALARRTKAVTEARICPHCTGNNVLRHGKDQNQRQRFRCRGCKRSYNILTGTAMARARKPEKWQAYLGFLTQHHTIRAIHAAGIGLNHVTIWRWRHRFLQAGANDNAALLCGVIEADVTVFAHSRKGSRGGRKATPPGEADAGSRVANATQPQRSNEPVPVLTALDRCGGVAQAMLSSVTGIATALRGRIAAGSVLCARGQAGYATVADQAKAELRLIRVVPPSKAATGQTPPATPGGMNGRLGLGRVHAHHTQLRHLIDERCRGVATRYLGNYLGWHRAMLRPGFRGQALLARALALYDPVSI